MSLSIPLTHAAHGHILANRNCWTADSRSLLYDLRDDETRFDSPSIMRLDVATGISEPVHCPGDGAPCGVPTCSPVDNRIVFIAADPQQDDDWQYCPWHRRGVIVDLRAPATAFSLDARDVVPPFTPGALRGGTHLHTFNHDASAVVSTYEDHVLATADQPTAEKNRRGVAVHLLSQPVTVPKSHRRNHDGISFSVLVSQLVDQPQPGSDQIMLASGEAWLAGPGNRIVMQGTVIDRRGQPCVELFMVTLPERWTDLGVAGDHPLEGTLTTRPGVPANVHQQRLTYTSDRRFPGVVGPRHWAVGSPDGRRIGCYLRDSGGRVQFWTVSPTSGDLVQVTHDAPEPTSPFTWHPDGDHVAYIADGRVMLVQTSSGRFWALTPPRASADGPTHHACVVSPDGTAIAYLQPVDFVVRGETKRFNQIHIVRLDP